MSTSCISGRRLRALAAGVGAVAAVAALAPAAPAANAGRGNVIFLHPDGAGLNHWTAARAYWAGPDGNLNWDRLPYEAAYRGHMKDVIYSSSNAAATTHAFGFKVDRGASYGRDADDEDTSRTIDALSGYTGSLMRQAGNRGLPVGVVNDGTVTEPGTGAFLAEVASRDDNEAIALQMVTGRDEDDEDPQVIMGAGEQYFLPAPTDAERAAPNARTNGLHGWGAREDGRDLIAEAEDRGYTVVRTRAEYRAALNALTSGRCARRPLSSPCVPKVLALFARTDTYNDVPEEQLIAQGLRIPGVDVNAKTSDLLLFGTWPGVPNPDPTYPIGQLGANGQEVNVNGKEPPTFAEMTELALLILDREAERRGKPFMFIGEPESTDNFANQNNAIDMFAALNHRDDAIGVARDFLKGNRRTLLMNGADGDASGMQIIDAPRGDDGTIGATEPVQVNPTAVDEEGDPVGADTVATDGLYGRGTRGFESAPDQFGKTLPISVLWTGPDALGGILWRAEGRNAGLFDREFSERFDNVDVYRIMHRTLFGLLPAYPEGREAPTR